MAAPKTFPRSAVLIVIWLAGCVLVTVAAAAAYVVAQQVGRRAADDVPRALASQQVAALAAGREPSAPEPALALSSQSPPFVIVYDAAHRIVATSVGLGTLPGVPDGVLDQAVAKDVLHSRPEQLGSHSATVGPRTKTQASF